MKNFFEFWGTGNEEKGNCKKNGNTQILDLLGTNSSKKTEKKKKQEEDGTETQELADSNEQDGQLKMITMRRDLKRVCGGIRNGSEDQKKQTAILIGDAKRKNKCLEEHSASGTLLLRLSQHRSLALVRNHDRSG